MQRSLKIGMTRFLPTKQLLETLLARRMVPAPSSTPRRHSIQGLPLRGEQRLLKTKTVTIWRLFSAANTVLAHLNTLTQHPNHTNSRLQMRAQILVRAVIYALSAGSYCGHPQQYSFHVAHRVFNLTTYCGGLVRSTTCSRSLQLQDLRVWPMKERMHEVGAPASSKLLS